MPTIHLEAQISPAELQERLEQLDDKRANETLTPDEHAELLCLVAQVEALEAQRIERLSRLAHLRGVSLAALMDELGILRGAWVA